MCIVVHFWHLYILLIHSNELLSIRFKLNVARKSFHNECYLQSVLTDQVHIMLCLDVGRKPHSTSKCTVKDIEVEMSRLLVGARDGDRNRKKG